MATIRLETYIAASPERVFDMTRDIAAHARTTAGTQERVVAAPEGGMLTLGDEVTFEAVHLGVRQRLTARVVEYDRPRRFVDEMTRGAFARLRHTHAFQPEGSGTRMVDTLEFASPFGPVGRLFDGVFLAGYMRRFLSRKNAAMKDLLERA
jgi:ligand-binding SRPBCC domain-containing protein